MSNETSRNQNYVKRSNGFQKRAAVEKRYYYDDDHCYHDTLANDDPRKIPVRREGTRSGGDLAGTETGAGGTITGAETG